MWQQALLLALQEPSFAIDKMNWDRQSLRYRTCLSYVLSSLINSGYFDDNVKKEREVEQGLTGKSWILRIIFAVKGKTPIEVQASSRTVCLEQSREVRWGHTKAHSEWGRAEGRNIPLALGCVMQSSLRLSPVSTLSDHTRQGSTAHSSVLTDTPRHVLL